MHLTQYINPDFIIKTVGLIGVIIVVFAETGLLLGFFLPGDSLLFTAGFLSSQGLLPIFPLLIFSIIAAILGDSVGYAIGKKVGLRIFSREHAFVFKKAYVEKTQELYTKFGKKIIILARFMPVIRTIAPTFAGVGQMNYKTFLSYNIIGGIAWTSAFILGGFFLGKSVPQAKDYLSVIVIAIIILSIIPALVEFIKLRKKN